MTEASGQVLFEPNPPITLLAQRIASGEAMRTPARQISFARLEALTGPHSRYWKSYQILSNFGGAEGSRTPDLCSAIAALSQLSYSPAAGLLFRRRRRVLSIF